MMKQLIGNDGRSLEYSRYNLLLSMFSCVRIYLVTGGPVQLTHRYSLLCHLRLKTDLFPNSVAMYERRNSNYLFTPLVDNYEHYFESRYASRNIVPLTPLSIQQAINDMFLGKRDGKTEQSLLAIQRSYHRVTLKDYVCIDNGKDRSRPAERSSENT